MCHNVPVSGQYWSSSGTLWYVYWESPYVSTFPRIPRLVNLASFRSHLDVQYFYSIRKEHNKAVVNIFDKKTLQKVIEIVCILSNLIL